MNHASLTDSSPDLRPVASNERIQALDVVRGFALIGIFLMNIEYFNRPLSEIELGLPRSLTGIDWAAGWAIYTFVQGKFWTMFSLLFGMGFAVMLTRAERADRNFLRPYLRRIAALAVFGALHHIFIWGGDILFSYAVGAVGLLLLLYGSWTYLLLAVIALVAASLMPGMGPLVQVVVGLMLVCLGGLFLRWDAKTSFMGRQVPAFSLILGITGGLAFVVGLVFWVLPQAPHGARWPVTVIGALLALLGYLSARYRDPPEKRTRRLGVTMYLIPFLIMTISGITQVYAPQSDSAPATASAAAPVSAAASSIETVNSKPATKPAPAVESPAVQRENELKQYQDRIANEKRILTQGSYAEAVRLRAAEFVEHAPGEAGFALVIIGMFLLGSWFVRSGIMENTGAHLPLFRKLALCGLPVGIGLGLLASSIATGSTPGMEHDPYQIAMGLSLMGNLPACLGYVSLIVLMLHSGTVLARIRVLAPLGRMALTNYLTHSIVGTLYFYHYGFGHWGMPRATQVLFVAIVITLQVLFCHWWLARFRYGPMEWLWRAITYWELPPMRREASPAITAGRATI